MAHITEHHSEEEWEGNKRNNNWIGFFVSWNTIGVNNQLPDSRELIGSEHGWWNDCCVFNFGDLASLRRVCSNLVNIIRLESWSPEITDECLVG
jgi:hypothetical protein